jgi:hypothetical protein
MNATLPQHADRPAQDLNRVRDQRDRYRDALIRIICAPTIKAARKIVSDTFKEDTLCPAKPH